MAINWQDAERLLVAYKESLQNIVPYLSTVWNRISQLAKAEYDVVGNEVKVPLILTRGHGFSADVLANIVDPGLNSAVHKFYRYYINQEFDFRVMDTDKALNIIAQVLDNRINEMKDHFERMFFYDGTGKLGVITSVINAPTYGVKSAYVPNIAAYALDATKLFRIGQRVSVVAPNGTIRGSSYITSIDPANKTITLADIINGAAADDFFVIENNYNKEFVGLWGIAFNTSYGNIPTSSDWTAYIIGGANGNDYALDAQKLFNFFTSLQAHMGAGYRPTVAITTPNVMGKLFEVSKDIIRYTLPTDQPYTINISSVSIIAPTGQIEIMASNYCPEGCLFAFDASAFKYDYIKPFDWVRTQSGDYFIPKVAVGETRYSVVGSVDFAFFTVNRRALGVIKNIQIA